MNRIFLAGVLCVFALPVFAAEVAGVKVADTAQVGAQSLLLNGAGVRNKWMFKVYGRAGCRVETDGANLRCHR